MSEITTNSQKRARTEDLATSTDESPTKKLKLASPTYLLCGVYEDSTHSLIGNVFTPTSPEGERVVKTLLALAPGINRNEAMDIFVRNFSPDMVVTSEEKEDIRQFFPFIVDYSSIDALGTLGEWSMDDLTPVIPIYCVLDY